MGEYTLKYLGNYLDGEFCVPAKPDGKWIKTSPADLKENVCEIQYCSQDVETACQSARQAFPKWAGLKIEERIQYLNRLQEIYTARKAEMAEIISRETGKPLWETLGEAGALAGKINVTVSHSLRWVKDQVFEDILPGVQGALHFKARGVMAVVGPYNFPAHLPNGHIVPALLMGNTVVFKPSEVTPGVGQFLAEMVHEAGFPPGVFNMVQGKGDIGKDLVTHDEVDGVLFTGSYETGLKIKQDTMNQYWKLLALEMGGKNASIVWRDADLDKAIYENLAGAFITSGQRCSCTSRILVHKDVHDQFVERFHAAAKKIEVGYWKDNPFMGPLVNETAVENYIRFQGIARREGAESLMRGKALTSGKEGHYVSPSINLVETFDPKSIYQKTEIFGPNVAIFKTEDFDQALEVNNATGFGLVMALFSKDEKLYRTAMERARVGLVNWNRGTPGASSKLPFGGMGKSGNDRPSADLAVQYCTVPVASLIDHGPFNPSKVMPGLNFQT